MTFADGIGTTFTLGKYTVRIGLRPDNPAFAKYLIFRGDKLVGRQFSRPSESDCRWLEFNQEYARSSRSLELALLSGVSDPSLMHQHRDRGGEQTRRRGRPRKDAAERELQEALTS